MATAGIESPISDRKPVVNFSRPRLGSNATTEPSKSRPTTPKSPQVHAIQAFHGPSQHPPDEYTLEDPGRPNLTPSDSSNSAATQLSGDTKRSELSSRSERRPHISTQDQRHTAPYQRNHSSGNDTSGSSSGSTAVSFKQGMPKGILKHTQVDQYSERAESETGESNGSHHTVSEEGGCWDENGKWTSSDYDTSGLSEKEMKKLERKGVNPRLYAEMKAARKEGKSCVGGLTGNAFVT